MGKVLTVATVASNLSQFDRENLKLMKDMGHSIHIACNFNEGNSWSEKSLNEFKTFLNELDAEIFDIGFSREITNISAIRSSYKSLLKIVKAHGYDLIHCHTPIASAICRMVSKKTGTRVMYTAHGFHFYKGAPLKNNLIFKTAERTLAKYTDMLITMNDEDLHSAKSFKLRKGGSVEYIPGIGLDIAKIQNSTADRGQKLAEFGIPADSTVILTVAELIKRKNYKTSLDAFSKISTPNTYYLICGSGPLEEELKAQADRLAISDKVRFLGYRDDVYELLQACDIFFFASNQEGLPVAVMEAMAAGLPVIASQIRGCCELVDDGKGGYLVDRSRADVFAQRIDTLVQNGDLRRQMGEYSRQKINEFSQEKVNILMRENYLKLLRSPDTADQKTL